MGACDSRDPMRLGAVSCGPASSIARLCPASATRLAHPSRFARALVVEDAHPPGRRRSGASSVSALRPGHRPVPHPPVPPLPAAPALLLRIGDGCRRADPAPPALGARLPIGARGGLILVLALVPEQLRIVEQVLWRRVQAPPGPSVPTLRHRAGARAARGPPRHGLRALHAALPSTRDVLEVLLIL